ncbi:sigma-70 family RNA polymerase sigma factor [Paenibacillus sp. HJL G12]|uniref:Sigma-70 family RNA polymerase sigma factor n=2 Tax=Paenibacillus dendrobii TaxID=2691084 RepID=A0A7X3IFU3_9BACL|nr:sigma-70 family RNA polymerase sigma factor [Paenibacillus dendrobii]
MQDLHNTDLIEACKYNNELLGEFLTANRQFIFSVLKHYKGNIEELKLKFNISDEDLYQHACIGIITAIKEFDVNRGVKFTTFAVRPILWEVNQLLYSDSQHVRLSRSAVDLIKKMVEIEETLGHRPNEDEMSKLLNVSVDRYREIAMFSDEIKHYDGIENFDIADSNGGNLEEKVTNQVYVDSLLKDELFSEFEKQVMSLILEGAENHTQIAAKLGVYPMTINRTLARIRTKIMNKEANVNREEKVRSESKYDREISIISQEIKERKIPLCIEEIADLLEVCGFDTTNYTTRVFYYMRQKASQSAIC